MTARRKTKRTHYGGEPTMGETRNVGVVLPIDVVARLESLATIDGVSNSAYLRDLLMTHLAELDARRQET